MLLRYSLLFLISLASLRGRISVLALHLTERTAFNKDLQERYLEPTSRPGGSNAIRARQAGSLNPGVCGWINGDEANPVTCAPQFICGTTQASIVGCCKSTTGRALCANIVTTCYDYLGASCGLSCQANLNNLICTSPSPYCVEYLYPSGSIGYGCGPYARYTKSVALSVASNSGGGVLTGVGAPTTASPLTSTSSSTSTSSTSSSQGLVTTPSPSIASSRASKVGGGAIAGIAVGSVIGVTLLSVILWLLWKRRVNTPEQVPESADLSNPNKAIRGSGTTYGSIPSPKAPSSLSGCTTPMFDRSTQDRPYIGPTIPEMSGAHW